MVAGYTPRMRDVHYPLEYAQATTTAKPVEHVWADINRYTCEISPEEDYFFHNIDFSVLIPPLAYEGTFLKGLYFSQAVDVLNQKFPRLPRIFHSIANSMWSSCPWAQSADAYFLLYPNEARLAYERARRPELRDRVLLPFQDADLTNEYTCAPTPHATRDIELLCVSTLSACKNLPLIAAALKRYRADHPEKPIRMVWVVGTPFGLNQDELEPGQREIMRAIERELVHVVDYLQIVPRMDYLDLIKYYGRARAVVLGALIEGKNRSLYEAMCANTPVIAFKDYNQWTRGPEPLFPEGAGELADFGAEPLAAAIHRVLSRPEAYKPRRRYLEWKGRKASFNRIVDAFPYYAATMPDYEPGNAAGNMWLDLACQEHYGLSFHDYLYEKQNGLSRPLGIERLTQTADYYLYKFIQQTR
ncbi:MAG: putative glycosyl transferase [Cyanobacteria bacterium RYN_339]|nr:putative glycosyl transferase [Cyanobacteria bacterium RYN_339]